MAHNVYPVSICFIQFLIFTSLNVHPVACEVAESTLQVLNRGQRLLPPRYFPIHSGWQH